MLAALYDATGGPTWTNSSNWKTTVPPGVPFNGEAAGVTGPADAAAALNATAPAVAARRNRIADEANQPQPTAGSRR